MDYIAKMSIYANIIAYENEVFTDVANESAGGTSSPIKAFIQFLIGIIDKIGRGISKVINMIRSGISKLKKNKEDKAVLSQQLKSFITRSNEASELLEKGASIISHAVKSIDKTKLNDNDLDNLDEFNAKLMDLRPDVEDKLDEMSKAKPMISMFIVGVELSQLERLLANMVNILDKLTAMKSQVIEIDKKMDQYRDESSFRRITSLLKLRNNITYYSLTVMQFNSMIMEVAH